MTAGNYVITGRLDQPVDQPAAARENGYCDFTYFLESSCCLLCHRWPTALVLTSI